MPDENEGHEEGEGGKHGIRHYEGYDKDQHDKDVSGNNLQIGILEKAVDEAEKKKQEQNQSAS